MPIKQVSTQCQFEYTSPDKDIFIITYMENEDRKYVEIKRKENDSNKQIYDLEMLFDITQELSSITRRATRPTTPSANFPTPNVVDHRASGIQDRVTESMNNKDDNIKPIESFSQDQDVSEKGGLKKWANNKNDEDQQHLITRVDAGDLI